MPRPRKHTKESLAASAMNLFWQQGYEATSLDDLVQATGVSRHGIYGDYGGKHALFVAGFEIYQQQVVNPAFAQVEREGAGLEAVAAYFEQQILRAETQGLPGPGCLVANTMTETTCHDDEVLQCVAEHLQRLRSGYAQVLRNQGCSQANAALIAEMMVTFTQGLWSSSRVVREAAVLRSCVAEFIDLVKLRISS